MFVYEVLHHFILFVNTPNLTFLTNLGLSSHDYLLTELADLGDGLVGGVSLTSGRVIHHYLLGKLTYLGDCVVN